jgi:hypothetical protein
MTDEGTFGDDHPDDAVTEDEDTDDRAEGTDLVEGNEAFLLDTSSPVEDDG